jgi:hypothetical protein
MVLLATKGPKMKFSVIKAALAVCLLAPAMSFAVTTASFADSATKTVNIIGSGELSVKASWLDLLAKYSPGPFQVYEASSLIWTLNDSSNHVVLNGSLIDSVAGKTREKNLIVLKEAGLAKGQYTLNLVGTWDVGQQDWNVKRDVDVTLGKATFSALSPVPEPESYALLLAGLGLMGTIAVRRKSKNS